MLGFVQNLGGAMRPLSTRAGLRMGAGAAGSGLLFSAGESFYFLPVFFTRSCVQRAVASCVSDDSSFRNPTSCPSVGANERSTASTAADDCRSSMQVATDR